MDMQKFVNAMSEVGRQERSKYHLTLGKLIDHLQAFLDAGGNPSTRVEVDMSIAAHQPIGVANFHSYRGYYADLALETLTPEDGPALGARSLLDAALKACGATFTGWKGGDFVMGTDTPLWLAQEGCTSDVAIIDGTYLEDHNVIVLITRKVET